MKYYRSRTEDGVPSCIALVKDEQVKHNALESCRTGRGETIRLQTIALDAEWKEMPEAEVKKRFPRLHHYIATGKDDYVEPMKLMVIYLKPLDVHSDAALTEHYLIDDFPTSLTAIEDAARRAEIRRQLGEPIHTAVAEGDKYRDVDVFEITGVSQKEK